MSIENSSTNRNISEEKKESVDVLSYKDKITNHPKIRLADTMNDLELYSYTQCTNEDDELVKKTRGVVFDGNDCVFRGYTYTYEYNANNLKEIKNKLGNDLSTYKINKSLEGTSKYYRTQCESR